MNSSNISYFEFALRVAAIAQFSIAILNLFLIRIMKWKPDLDRAPLLRTLLASTAAEWKRAVAPSVIH